jgi:Tol biopolymer transport system component
MESPKSSPPPGYWLAAGCALLACAIAGLSGIFFAWRFVPAARPTPPPLVFPTRAAQTPTPQPPPATLTVTPPSGPSGKIVYVCQIYKAQASDQICIINADGTGQRRLTTRDDARHYYPSLAPDGQSVLFSSNMDRRFELYELDLTGQLTRLGQTGIAPAVSPDNHYIAFTQNFGSTDSIWLMDRRGGNPRQVIANGWDPTWSPDGQRLLFATTLKNSKVQLMTSNLEGGDQQQVTNLPALRGRSAWSSDGSHIVTYSGQPWQRQIYLLGADGSNPHAITAAAGNAQGPSFSPDGQWVVFTAYFDHPENIHGCEIYIMQIDGTHLTRLTDNNYCDWQPRWGP